MEEREDLLGFFDPAAQQATVFISPYWHAYGPKQFSVLMPTLGSKSILT